MSSHWIRDEKRAAVILRGHCACVYCGEYLPKGLGIDHVVPREHGGSNHESNLVVCCNRCNRLKGTKRMVVFVREITAGDKDLEMYILREIKNQRRRKLNKVGAIFALLLLKADHYLKAA